MRGGVTLYVYGSRTAITVLHGLRCAAVLGDWYVLAVDVQVDVGVTAGVGASVQAGIGRCALGILI